MNPATDASQFAFLHDLGIARSGQLHRNFPSARLVQEAVRRDEVQLTEGGSVVAVTGTHTGRSPEDKYVVRDNATESAVWWGSVNHPMEAEQFDRILGRVASFLEGRELFVIDGSAGADDAHRIPIRVITMHAWHALFAQNVFLPPGSSTDVEPFTVLHAPDFLCDPAIDGTRSDVLVALDFTRRLVLICGTQYAGEIKKAVFSIVNYMLPRAGVLPMHCSANEGFRGDVAIFFGLSGTGKTTLSADAERVLIGDDEHGWSDEGVFNVEGGCYAKVINLSPELEPEIFSTTHRFGTILENVVQDPISSRLDLSDDSLTENTRAAYPIAFMPRVKHGLMGGHPSSIIMLTADAFGVLPPVSRLTPEQSMYYFLSGYTAKVAGTEAGISEPVATFSACFGAPFLPLPPVEYARLLGERLAEHRAQAWLVNTGWTGGPYGTGHRMPIAGTRAIIRAILSGALADSVVSRNPIFGLDVPVHCEGVSDRLLDQESTWPSRDAYQAQANSLAAMFASNFDQFAGAVPDTVRAAGPRGS